METTFTGVRLNVMTYALYAEEGSLPQGLMVQNAYTEMCTMAARMLSVIVRNSTCAYPQTLKKKILSGHRLVAANWVSEPQMWSGMIDACWMRPKASRHKG